MSCRLASYYNEARIPSERSHVGSINTPDLVAKRLDLRPKRTEYLCSTDKSSIFFSDVQLQVIKIPDAFAFLGSSKAEKTACLDLADQF